MSSGCLDQSGKTNYLSNRASTSQPVDQGRDGDAPVETPRDTTKENLLGESGAAMRSRTSNLLIRRPLSSSVIVVCY